MNGWLFAAIFVLFVALLNAYDMKGAPKYGPMELPPPHFVAKTKAGEMAQFLAAVLLPPVVVALIVLGFVS